MDDLELLRELRNGVPKVNAEELRIAHDAFERRVEHRPATRPERRVRRWVVPAAVLATALVLALVLPALLGGPGGADPAAAAALRRVARVAAGVVASPTPRTGQYVYTKSVGTQYLTEVPGAGLASYLYGVPVTREAWIGVDGSGRLRETTGDISFPTNADRSAWIDAGSPNLAGAGEPSDESFGPGDLRYLDLSSLPTDSVALQGVIEDRTIVGGPDGDWETFAIVGDLLRETAASPALRAALYEVAANLPGVEFIGPTTDGTGRPGIGVAYTHGGTRDELIFDPETSVLLGENQVITDPSQLGDGGLGPVGPIGSILYSVVYLESGVVDSTHQSSGT